MLAGEAVVAIWNGIAPEAREQFYDWHTNEHMPERVGIPGGRRYVAADADTFPTFFTLYETDTMQVLQGSDYANRLNDPTPGTKATTAQFRDTARALSAGYRRSVSSWRRAPITETPPSTSRARSTSRRRCRRSSRAGRRGASRWSKSTWRSRSCGPVIKTLSMPARWPERPWKPLRGDQSSRSSRGCPGSSAPLGPRGEMSRR